MRTTLPLQLDSQQISRIQAALDRSLPEKLGARPARETVGHKGDDLVVSVVPASYPEEMYEFLHGLASAEIDLRDSGLPVRLHPKFAQRMLLVVKPPHRAPVAFLTSEGREDEDRRSIFPELSGTETFGYEGFFYDNASDLEIVLKEAKNEHPDADFTRVSNVRS